MTSNGQNKKLKANSGVFQDWNDKTLNKSAFNLNFCL